MYITELHFQLINKGKCVFKGEKINTDIMASVDKFRQKSLWNLWKIAKTWSKLLQLLVFFTVFNWLMLIHVVNSTIWRHLTHQVS